MPAFYYVAMNKEGKEEKGVLEAEHPKQARVLLRARQLIPIELLPAQQKTGSTFFKKRTSLNPKELALITRQIATLLSAGLPIEEVFFAVSEQSEKSRVKGLIFSVRSKILEGHTLAHALSEHSPAFSELYIATVAAGEKTGHLDQVLLRLADYTESQWQMRQKLQSALIYPGMIVLVAISIVGFLLEYVVPKMISLYAHLNQTLPLMTRILINLSDFLRQDGIYLLLIIILIVVGLRRLLRVSVTFRYRFQMFLLRLPLIGYIVKIQDTARFARTLAILSLSGVPVLEAMCIALNLIVMLPIKQSLQTAVMRVREGGAIHLALKQTTYFSPMSVHMIASGEGSGQLEPMLDRVAQNQENEISRMVQVALALFEPVIILLMGVVVLFIVLAVLLPIFELNQLTG